MPENAALIHPGEILLTSSWSRLDSRRTGWRKIWLCLPHGWGILCAVSAQYPPIRRCGWGFILDSLRSSG